MLALATTGLGSASGGGSTGIGGGPSEEASFRVASPTRPSPARPEGELPGRGGIGRDPGATDAIAGLGGGTEGPIDGTLSLGSGCGGAVKAAGSMGPGGAARETRASGIWHSVHVAEPIGAYRSQRAQTMPISNSIRSAPA